MGTTIYIENIFSDSRLTWMSSQKASDRHANLQGQMDRQSEASDRQSRFVT